MELPQPRHCYLNTHKHERHLFCRHIFLYAAVDAAEADMRHAAIADAATLVLIRAAMDDDTPRRHHYHYFLVQMMPPPPFIFEPPSCR